MALDLINLLVGTVPQGYEVLSYVMSMVISLYTIKIIYEMFYFVLNLIKKG